MISDEERRKVARQIRQLDQRGRNNLFSTCLNCGKWLGAVYGDEDYCAEKLQRFSDCLEIKNALAARIADLIDRPTCRLDHTDTEPATDGYPIRVYECSNCGRTFDELYGEYEYCPHCGAEVVE